MDTSGFNKKGFSATTPPPLGPSPDTESFSELEETPESEPSAGEDPSSATAATAVTAAIVATHDAAVSRSSGPEGAPPDGDDEASGAATDRAAKLESDEIFYAEEGELDVEADAAEESAIPEVVKPLVELVESAAESIGYTAGTAVEGVWSAEEEEQREDSEAAESMESAAESMKTAVEGVWSALDRKGSEVAESMKSAAESTETAVEGVGSAEEEEQRKDSEAAESTDSAIERKKQRIRSEALSGVTEETESASDGLKKELEHGMLQVLYLPPLPATHTHVIHTPFCCCRCCC